MTINQLIECEAEAPVSTLESRPILLTTRIRLARNLEGHAFPGWASEADRESVRERCRDALSHLVAFEGAAHLDIENLDPTERHFLVERHLISKELAEAAKGSAVAIDRTRTLSVMINEEDHLRIQAITPGLDFDALWKTSCAIDAALETRLDYAFRERWGYLTACPTNVGTGLRASAMLHLPGLVMTKQMDKVVRAVNQLGVVARGLFGESSDPTGSVFQISNQQTLGESEDCIIQRIGNLVRSIMEQEQNARIRLFETEGNLMVDRIARAFGILRHAHLLNSTEAMNLLSMMRLAADVAMLPEPVRNLVDELMIQTQPAHLQLANGAELEPEKRDILRAERVRKAFLPIVDPNPATLNFDTPLKPRTRRSRSRNGKARS
jgi:protein arginine kinase